MTEIPAIASAFAESPSVRINVHFSAFLVPAQLASSSFGIPNNLVLLCPLRCCYIYAFSFAFAIVTMLSSIPEFTIL